MISWLLLLSFSRVLYQRGLRYLRYLQQEDYTPFRFLKWLFQHRLIDTRYSLILCVGALLSIYLPTAAPLLVAVSALMLSIYEENPLQEGKITLKMTARAKRVFYTYLALSLFLLWTSALELTPPLCHLSQWIYLFSTIQLIPFTLVAATYLLSFEEKKRQKALQEEARNKLLSASPYIIGITGSYGKTSAKNLLGNTLQIALGPTFWPSKGVNTIMGATREIRERFRPGYKYAIMEMGAYYPGSIKRLCDFSPINAAWITCIGLAHLERFKSPEAILNTKGELADSLAPGSLLVLNGDNEGCRILYNRHADKKGVLYGLDNSKSDLDVWLHNYHFSEKGSRFEITFDGKVYKGQSLMVGSTALSNIAGAFAVACHLGADPQLALAALSQIQTIDNRLQLQKSPEGPFFIHDAYNSNPIGFESALDVLSKLPAERRILMTPGMIELGKLEYQLNKEAAQKAAKVCDAIIIVGDYNKKAMLEGLKESHFNSSQIYCCKHRSEAFQKLKELQQPQDAILIENDLSDLHEQLPRF